MNRKADELRCTAIGQQLREAREAAGMTQTEVAEAAGISQQHLSAIEAGRYRPLLDTACLIAEAVGCAVGFEPNRDGGPLRDRIIKR